MYVLCSLILNDFRIFLLFDFFIFDSWDFFENTFNIVFCLKTFTGHPRFHRGRAGTPRLMGAARADGRANGRMDGRTADGRTNAWTDGQTGVHTHGRADG